MRKRELSRRLQAAFDLVRNDRILVDIGTDHAYLPIALVTDGRVKSAYASDIGKGPLERAESNVNKAGLGDKISTVLTDGAAFFEGKADEFVIAGMGGELIFDIISRATFLKNENIHLILQPMTKIPTLRRSLYLSGFDVEKEKLVFEDNRVYTVMSVYFKGDVREINDFEATVGRIEDAISDNNEDLLILLLKGVIYDLDNKIKGKNNPNEEIILKEEIEKTVKSLEERKNENRTVDGKA